MWSAQWTYGTLSARRRVRLCRGLFEPWGVFLYLGRVLLILLSRDGQQDAHREGAQCRTEQYPKEGGCGPFEALYLHADDSVAEAQEAGSNGADDGPPIPDSTPQLQVNAATVGHNRNQDQREDAGEYRASCCVHASEPTDARVREIPEVTTPPMLSKVPRGMV